MITTIAQLPPIQPTHRYVCWRNDGHAPCATPGCGRIIEVFTAADGEYDGEHRHIPIVLTEPILDPPQGIATVPLDHLGLPAHSEVQLLEDW